MPLDLVVSKKGKAPFDVELVVFEKDTFRLLSASNFVQENRQSLDDVVQEMVVFEPERPGEILGKVTVRTRLCMIWIRNRRAVQNGWIWRFGN
jgi:hypothetical protein